MMRVIGQWAFLNQKWIAAISAISISSLMISCAPPSPQNTPTFSGDGIPIITVDPNPKPGPAFTTVEKDGIEFRQSPDPIGQYGGTFFAATIGGGPKTFNSWVSKDGTSSAMGAMLTAGLITNEPYTGQVIPDLAKSVAISDDKMTYTVTLRKGLTWSDGKPLTADDVVFTWNQIYKPGLGNSSSRDNSLVDGKFPEVAKVDDVTIRFKTAKPFSPFMRRLGYPIAPQHIFEPVVKQGESAFNAFWGTQEAAQHPEKFISSGMWLLESYDATMQRATFKRNPRFYMIDKAGNRLPYLDRYVVNFVNDSNNLALQFEQGKMDTYAVPGQYLTHVRQLKRPAFKIYNLGPSDTKTFVFFNLSNRNDATTGKPLVDPIKSAWFRNTAFRQAVNHAINRQDIVANILKGVGQAAFTAESPVSPFIHKELAKGYPQDLDKAKTILTQAGFTYDKAGKLHDPQGNLVAFELLTNSGNEERENIGVSIKEDLAKIGITVHFKPMEFNVLIGQYDTGTWEASIIGLGGGSPLEPHDGANVWRSDGALHMFNQRQPGKNGQYDLSNRFDWETQIDQLIEQGAQTFDFTQRQKIYNQMQQVVYDQQPFIYLVSPLQLMAVRDRLQNINPTPLGGITHNLESIWIKD